MWAAAALWLLGLWIPAAFLGYRMPLFHSSNRSPSGIHPAIAWDPFSAIGQPSRTSKLENPDKVSGAQHLQSARETAALAIATISLADPAFEGIQSDRGTMCDHLPLFTGQKTKGAK